MKSLYLIPVWIAVLLLPLHAYADETPMPFLEIRHINLEQFPRVEVAVSAGNLADDLRELSTTLLENGQPQKILADDTQQTGIKSAFLINLDRIDEVDGTGQSHYDAMLNLMLAMVQQEIVVRHKDQLAAFAIDEQGDLDTLQWWTGEPNLLFNQLVQKPPVTVTTARSVTNGLWYALDQFADSDAAPLGKSIILFSVGVNRVTLGMPSVVDVIAKANEWGVHIDTVEFATAEQPTGAANLLIQLAEGTGGVHLSLQSPTTVDALWARFSERRLHRTFVYQSTATTLQQIAVGITLPNGALIDDTRMLPALDPRTMHAAAPQAAIFLASASAAVNNTAHDLTATDADAPAQDDTPSLVTLPGTSFTLPYRTALVIAGLLLTLLAYLIVEEIGQQRRRSAAMVDAMDPGLLAIGAMDASTRATSEMPSGAIAFAETDRAPFLTGGEQNYNGFADATEDATEPSSATQQAQPIRRNGNAQPMTKRRRVLSFPQPRRNNGTQNGNGKAVDAIAGLLPDDLFTDDGESVGHGKITYV